MCFYDSFSLYDCSHFSHSCSHCHSSWVCLHTAYLACFCLYVHPSLLSICVVCVIVKYLSLCPHVRLPPRPVIFLEEIMPSSWLLSSRLEGLWKLRVYRPCCPQKISHRLPLIHACCCCSSANEAVCDHGTALSTLELRLPRCCLTSVSQRGHAHITLPNVLSLLQVSTSPFCLHAAIC